MRTRSRRRSVGHPTSTYWTSSTAKSPSVNSRSLAVRLKRNSTGSPEYGTARHAVHVAVAVHRHDAGALGGVRRGDLLADQRVEERRLAGVELPGDGDAERSVETGPQVGDLVAAASEHRPGAVEQLVHAGDEIAGRRRHCSAPMVTSRRATVIRSRIVSRSPDMSGPSLDAAVALAARSALCCDQRLLQRAIQLVGTRLVVLADVLLEAPEGVTGVGVDDEPDLVEVVRAHADQLLAFGGEALVAVLAERAAGEQAGERQRQQRDPRHRADDPDDGRQQDHATAVSLPRRDDPPDDAVLHQPLLLLDAHRADLLRRGGGPRPRRRRARRARRTPRRPRAASSFARSAIVR